MKLTGGTATVGMNHLGHELLSHARLAANQDRGLAGGDLRGEEPDPRIAAL